MTCSSVDPVPRFILIVCFFILMINLLSKEVAGWSSQSNLSTNCADHHPRVQVSARPNPRKATTIGMVSSGFSFNDGEQILVSVQKPFGIALEQQNDDEEEENGGMIVVVKVDPSLSAAKAGVRVGDVLVAVQNASTVSAELEQVLEFIATKCPRIVNLRFQRPTRHPKTDNE